MEESSETVIESKKKPARRKYIIAAGLFLLLIMPVLIFILLSQNQKPDPASETKIRQEVAKKLLNETGLTIEPNNLTDEDFAKIDRLELGAPVVKFELEVYTVGVPIYVPPEPEHISRELSDIRLLEKFTNLRYLSLNSINYPSDKIPKWMSLLSKLGIFNIEKRYALDLSPLKKLINLETLIIPTPVKNIKPLENLTNLQELWISGTLVYELEHVKKLKKLKTLIIASTQATDLEPVKGLKNLQHLYILGSENISDKQLEDLQKALPDLEISTKQKDSLNYMSQTYLKVFTIK